MDLIDEQDVAFAQVRERPDEIRRLFERWPRRRADVHPKLPREQLGEGGLP
jgi:hypothetical protein